MYFSFNLLAQSPPPHESPVITKVFQDRLSVGDLLEIEGRNFIPSGDYAQTFLIFENLPPISVSPQSNTKILATIPEGAKTGFIKVKTTCSVNNTYYELESNPIKVLIIWKEYDLRTIAEFFNNLYGIGNYYRNFAPGDIIPGKNDDIFLTFSGSAYSYYILLAHIEADGSWDFQEIGFFTPGDIWTWDITVDPVTNSAAVISVLPPPGDTFKIDAPGFASAYFQVFKCPTYNSCYNDWKPWQIFYDSEGRLYVLGYKGGDSNTLADDLSCIWRFNRGEIINMDPNGPNSLIPGGISGSLRNFYVGGSGDIAAQLWLDYQVYLFNLTRQGIMQVFSFPSGGYDWCLSLWLVAVDCNGTIYSTNYDRDCSPTIYRLPDNTPIFTIPDDICGNHLSIVDGYGNIYIKGNRRCVYGDPDYPIVRRILPEELPEGYYDCFTCCPENALRAEEGQCYNGVGDVNVCSQGELIVKMDRDPEDGIDNFVLFDKDNLNSDILFGQKPKFRAYWKEANGEEEILPVKWEMTEKNINSSPISIDNNKSLFPDTPFLEFNRGIDKKSELEGMSVHIGSFKLKVTSDESGKDGSLEITVTINSPSRLGTTYNNYDNEIIKYAHKYGIPPQYLKAHVHQEAKKENGQYVADSFRYEPLSIDMGREGCVDYGFLKGVWSWTPEQWNEHFTDFYTFNYPNGICLSPLVIEKINSFSKITSIGDNPQDPSRPIYQCSNYGSMNPPDIASVVDIYDGNNGWGQGSYPNVLYGRMGPCSRREGWDKAAFGNGNWVAFHDNEYYCENVTQPLEGCEGEMLDTIGWFYNNFDIAAQIPVCSSYGLMQVLYLTAVGHLEWMRDRQASERDPGLLLIPEVSIEMGASFDANKMQQKGQIESTSSFQQFCKAMKEGFARYNKKGVSYANEVTARASSFLPLN